MSLALVLAALAGVAAAVGITELAVLRADRGARAPGRPGAPAGPPGPRRPLFALLARVGRSAGVPVPRDLATRLEAAGLDGVRAGDLMAVKVGGAISAAVSAVLLGGALPGRLGLAAVVAGPAGTFVLPDLLLRRRTRDRTAVLARELPDVLDLLRVAVQAGLPAGRAMGEVGLRATGLLAAELRDGSRRLALGLPMAAVLDRLELRCPAPAVAALVTAMRRAARHGAPLALTLAALAADARAERARVLREQAARAAPKIQLVVALALVPGVLLLMAAMLLPRVGAP